MYLLVLAFIHLVRYVKTVSWFIFTTFVPLCFRVFLAGQFEFLHAHLEAMIPANKRSFLSQFYSQVSERLSAGNGNISSHPKMVFLSLVPIFHQLFCVWCVCRMTAKDSEKNVRLPQKSICALLFDFAINPIFVPSVLD